ncbi:MAG: Ig-like domain-containing protein [Oscillospiraceae bacterium]|nr:Ig-like domain-containing protein [Oscillospiraceae bacterium]
MIKKILSQMLTISILLSCIAFSGTNAFAVKTICEIYNGSNVECQDYEVWSFPVNSYICDTGVGIMRLQSDAVKKGYLVEYYDYKYNIVKSKKITQELPIFGGFYATDKNYFVLSGQTNYNEDDSVEVYRITKYDKNWNRLGSGGLYGANTYIPFDAGSARMTVSGKYLLVRTCHEMYKTDDGYHHQANVTFQFDIDNVKITDSFTSIMNASVGYASHSFNQFIQVENNKIVAVDHGDAYPRAVSLFKYSSDISDGTFSSSCSYNNVVEIPGGIGDNYTGTSVGGFEISDTSYLIAGNYVNFDDYENSETRNIFISATSKETGKNTVNTITCYGEADISASTPHLVKINDNRFLLMWSRKSKVYYTKIDGNGNRVSKIYTMNGNLSDCEPVVINGKIVWYTWNDEVNTFYEITTQDISKNNSVIIKNGHTFKIVNATKNNNIATQVCSVCGYKNKFKVPGTFKVWWKNGSDTTGYYYSKYDSKYKVGDTLLCWVTVNSDTSKGGEFKVSVSDKSVLSYKYIGNNTVIFSMKKAGTARVKISLKYRPDISKKFTINVGSNVKKTSLSISPMKKTLYVTGTTKIKATVKNGKGKTTYKSSNTKIAKVNSKGKVTAIKQGTAKITVTNNSVSKTLTVKVINPKLNRTSVLIGRGKSYILKIIGKIGTASFSSSNKRICTVNSKGNITVNKKARKGKTVTITVNTNGIKLTCKVKVK